ncbi:hypothetical protein A3D55_01495 [Candidatus Jorgensenbacteria bacterium RIFCSPHIGHO2_02_FULL_45_20]|uniref:PilN domain-containing protein n=2 Tax=Parcubacteria group TaxID=1794811 RepID=A0A1G1Y602_9BACT|nr:MAG: hypothetical protein A3D55_01495 [Candidatus Jorgensenbacteria bacterium RIFCSPHIGHO2_02_FULL_45_20]OGY47671.1 MAG: hypothetical protein A2840_00090 [Candidatus Buchananbacteria bacterium RIFCSPHIGHO2_01_FULL_47_11b]
MITLNLLPPQTKKEAHLLQLYLSLKNAIVLLLLFTTLAAITLLLAKLTLQEYFTRVVDQTTLTTQYGNIFSKDIKDVNRQLTEVNKIQSEYIPWTKFFAELSDITPEGIVIFNVNINGKDVTLSGFAQNRDQLLKLQQALSGSPLFLESDVPLENLLTRENINFNIKSSVDLTRLQSDAY